MKGKCEDCKQVTEDFIVALIDDKTFERRILCKGCLATYRQTKSEVTNGN